MVASLELLGKKSAPAAQSGSPASNVTPIKKPNVKKTPDPEPEPEPVAQVAQDEGSEVDVDALSSEELDVLIKDNDIAPPDGWEGWDASGKRSWLKSQFSEVPEAETENAGQAADAVTAPGAPAPQPEEAAVKPAKEKKQPKAKAAKAVATAISGESTAVATKSNVVEGTIIPADDPIAEMVHMVENLKENEAKDLVTQMADKAEALWVRLGGVLSLIMDNQWYKPYANFREYVETEHGIEYRKATYWVAIYKALADSGIPYEKVKHLGWTKLKEIAPVLTMDNLPDWLPIAEQNTVLKLVEIIKNTKKAALSASSGNAEAQVAPTAVTVTTMTFKVHDDQKANIEAALAKAKQEASTEFNTVALELICIQYLGASGVPLPQLLAKYPLEKIVEALSAAFPDHNLAVNVLPEGYTIDSYIAEKVAEAVNEAKAA